MPILVDGVSPSTKPVTTWTLAVRGPGRTGRRAGQRPSSSSVSAGRSRAASGRARRRRRRTAARGSSPAALGRCPSGGRACAPPPETSPRDLGAVRALPRRSELGDDHLVDQRNVDRDVEDVRGQFDAAGLLPAAVLTSIFVMARPLAFAAVLTRTSPPGGPGTAPLSSSSPWSASTACTLTFCAVTRTPPIRPAIRWPRKTRPGVAQRADGARRAVLALHTVGGAQAGETVPLHHSGEALALARPDDVDDLPGLEQLDRELLPQGVLARRRPCAARPCAGEE